MLWVSECRTAAWGHFPQLSVFGRGGCTVDVSGGCLEGVEPRLSKPWFLSVYRPYQVS